MKTTILYNEEEMRLAKLNTAIYPYQSFFLHQKESSISYTKISSAYYYASWLFVSHLNNIVFVYIINKNYLELVT